MGWFGPSKDEVWRQLSEEIGAEFVRGWVLEGGAKSRLMLVPGP